LKTINFVLSGLGGQGILFMTRVLANAAFDKKYNVLGAETHGMAQRGGSVVSHLRIGDVRSSLVRAGAADFLISTDEFEAYRYLPYLKKGGVLFANANPATFPDKRVADFMKKNKITAYCMEATKKAVSFGSPRSTNLAMIAFFAGFGLGPLNAGGIRNAVSQMSGKFKQTNLELFEACYTKGHGTAYD
jgi:indolepyruvate ferredoxin oxidoreductase, beta subunit